MPARKDSETVGGLKNRLYKMRGYLCGAMDRVPDGGASWRISLQQRLSDLGITWLDPTCKPTTVGVEDDVLRKQMHDLRRAGEYDAVAAIVKEIRAVDLRMVDIADFIIVNLDLEAYPCGTLEELFLANREKKPIIIHMEQGKHETPGWLFAAIPHQMIFSSWDEIENYLRHIAQDYVIQHFNRWMFFDYGMCRKV